MFDFCLVFLIFWVFFSFDRKLTQEKFVTEKGYFELADNASSIKILKDGFYRLKCQLTPFNSSSYDCSVNVQIGGTTVSRIFNRAYPNCTQVYCTMTSDTIHELKANQNIRFYAVNSVHGTLYDNDVYIEKL